MDITNAVHFANYTMHTVTYGAVQCCVPFTLKPLVALLFVQVFALRALSRCKHDMGTLSWINAERVSTPSLTIVRCTAHGRSFVSLRYSSSISYMLSLYETVTSISDIYAISIL